MSQRIITEAKPIEYNGAPRGAGDRGPPVEVVVSSETGRAEVVVQGGGEPSSRQAVIAAAKAKRAAAPKAAKPAKAADSSEDGAVGSGPPGEERKPPVQTANTGASEPPAEETEADDDVGSGPAGDEPEPVAAAPEAKASEPAASKPAETAADEPSIELARARDRIDEMNRARETERETELEAFIDDPIKALRGYVAARLGVPEDHEAVTESMAHLTEELTWGAIPAQDLPQDKKAQLDMARWSRTNRLQSHRRKADQGKRARDDIEQRARTQAERSYGALRQQHPNLELVAEIDGRDVRDVINATLVRAMQAGVIKPETPIEAAYQEAIRLADAHATTRAKTLAARFAHLATAPAPKQPGASSQTKAPDKQPSSPAAPRAPSPRALPAAQAGAAPSRPAEPAPTKPKRIEIDMSRHDDPEDRRREVLSRHARRT